MDREHIRRLRQIADEARLAQDPSRERERGHFGLNIADLRVALQRAADDIDKIIREAI